MADNPTLRHGDATGDGWVEYLQEVLNFNLLFLGTPTQVDINGRFDDATDAAVREYQRIQHLTVDGVVGDQTWASLRGEHARGIGTDGRDPHTFVQEGDHATIFRERSFDYTQNRAPQPDGLVLYCANTGSTRLEARSHSATCSLSSPLASVDCDLVLVPDGQSVAPGDTFWFESENLVLEPAEYSYTVTLPDALGGDSMTGAFTVE
jgi:Putative peptidoglycan binding domain